MTPIIEEYQRGLTEKRNSLITKIEQLNPTFPEDNKDSNISDNSPSKSTMIPKISIIAGLGLAIIGLCTKSTATVVVGALAIGGGTYIAKSSSKDKVESSESNLDYDSLNKHLLNSFNKLSSAVVNEWDEYLTKMRNSFMNQLLLLNLKEDVLNKANDIALYKSVINVSNSQWLIRLNNASRKEDIQEFHNIVSDFKKSFIKAINDAYEEQKNRFDSINQLCE